MPDLLIRNISEPTKRQLSLRAAKNGRSQQAEALSILEESLNTDQHSWFESLRKMSEDVGGIDFPEVKRHSPRITGISL